MSLLRRNLRAALNARHLSCFDRRWAQTPRQESGRRPRARSLRRELCAAQTKSAQPRGGRGHA
eukprot:7138791-Pyramimonas_sp.AAC.1